MPTPLPRLAPRHTIIAEAAAPVADTPLQVVAYAAGPPTPIVKPRLASTDAFEVASRARAAALNSLAAPDFDFGSPQRLVRPSRSGRTRQGHGRT